MSTITFVKSPEKSGGRYKVKARFSDGSRAVRTFKNYQSAFLFYSVLESHCNYGRKIERIHEYLTQLKKTVTR